MSARKANAAKAKEQAPTPEMDVNQEQAPAPEMDVNQEQAPAPDVIIAEVVEKFRDKESGSIFKPGAIIAVTAARFQELDAAGVAKQADV